MVVTNRGIATQTQYTRGGVVARRNPRHAGQQAKGVPNHKTNANRDRGTAQLATVAITKRQVGIERDRPIAFLIEDRHVGRGTKHRGIIDPINQQARGGGETRQAQARANGAAIIKAGNQAVIEVDGVGQHNSVGVLVTGLDAIAEHQAAGGCTAQISGDSTGATIEGDRQRWSSAGGHNSDGPIKLHSEIKVLVRGIGAISRQGHLRNHRCIGMVSAHVHQHGPRLNRHRTSVIHCQHREGTQGIGATAIGIRRRRPVGIGISINQRIAACYIGRGQGLAATNLEAAAEQLLHHQAAHRAICIGHLGLARAIANQIAKADRDRAVL